MAIVVEKKKSINLGRFIGWGAILVMVGVAVYYLFFVSPELVPISAPAGLTYITPISQASLHPEDVLNTPAFQALKVPPFPLPTPQGPAPVGRPNPFLAP